MNRPDLLGPDLRVVIVGTRRVRPDEDPRWYAGAGNQFWTLLSASGLVPGVVDDEELPALGVGLTDLLWDPVAGSWQLERLQRAVRRYRPRVVAFVSKTAAGYYARAAKERRPVGYGPLSWTVAGRPAFVLPGPSGANNAMSLPLRTALWRDLADFLPTV